MQRALGHEYQAAGPAVDKAVIQNPSVEIPLTGFP